jgi:hypothetical protein
MFVRSCARSRLGWLLAGAHAVWFYFGIQSMGPPSRAAASFLDGFQRADWTFLAGRPFHYTYQSWALKSLILADMPTMLVGSFFGLLMSPFRFLGHIGTYERSYITAGLLFVVASGQWLMVGHLLQKRFRHHAA